MLAFSCYEHLFWSKHMISILRERVKVGIKLNGKGDFAAFWAGLATDIALLVGQGSQQTSAEKEWNECWFWDLQANNHEVGHENWSIQDKNWSKEKWIVRFVRSVMVVMSCQQFPKIDELKPMSSKVAILPFWSCGKFTLWCTKGTRKGPASPNGYLCLPWFCLFSMAWSRRVR